MQRLFNWGASLFSSESALAQGMSEAEVLEFSSGIDRDAATGAINAFGLDLWQRLRSEHEGKNLAISPFSLSVALTMTYAGATSTTAEDMAEVLHLPSSDPEEAVAALGRAAMAYNDPERESYRISVANRLFGELSCDFRDAFIEESARHFGAGLHRLDFGSGAETSRRFINAWVREQTLGRINELLPPKSVDDNLLVLVNALYFQGKWLSPFESELTLDMPFHCAGESEPAKVSTMRATSGRYAQVQGAKLLELPYEGGELAMLFALPDERQDLPALEESLSAELVEGWAALVAETPNLEIALPRFRIETRSIPLKSNLTDLGMGIAFTEAARFEKISEHTPLMITEVFHKVFINVDEQGTEAAAATAVTMLLGCAPPPREPPAQFIADHPFLFFLRDLRSGAILFAGRVVDPR